MQAGVYIAIAGVLSATIAAGAAQLSSRQERQVMRYLIRISVPCVETEGEVWRESGNGPSSCCRLMLVVAVQLDEEIMDCKPEIR